MQKAKEIQARHWKYIFDIIDKGKVDYSAKTMIKFHYDSACLMSHKQGMQDMEDLILKPKATK